MKTILNGVDKAVGFIFKEVGGLLTAATFLLVIYTVLCRYVFKINTGGIDELSTYFVVCSVWVGSVLTSRAINDGQIKIDFLRVIVKSEKANLCVDVLWQLISIASMAIFSVIAYNHWAKQFARGNTLNGIDIPMWLFTGCMLVCSALIVIYELRKTVFIVRQIAQKAPEGGTN